MTVTQEIRQNILDELTPDAFELFDESESHRGHAGYQEGGESHFRIVIRSKALDGLTRIAQHRKIHAAIGPEVMARIHALAIQVER